MIRTDEFSAISVVVPKVDRKAAAQAKREAKEAAKAAKLRDKALKSLKNKLIFQRGCLAKVEGIIADLQQQIMEAESGIP